MPVGRRRARPAAAPWHAQLRGPGRIPGLDIAVTSALAGHVRPGPWPLQGPASRDDATSPVVLSPCHSARAAASAARTPKRAPVTLAPPRARSYGVDATSTPYQRHGWDIH